MMHRFADPWTPLLPGIALLAAAALITSCKPAANTFAPPPAPEVTVANPINKSITQFLEYTGTTEPFETVDVRARVTGPIAFEPIDGNDEAILVVGAHQSL